MAKKHQHVNAGWKHGGKPHDDAKENIAPVSQGFFHGLFHSGPIEIAALFELFALLDLFGFNNIDTAVFPMGITFTFQLIDNPSGYDENKEHPKGGQDSDDEIETQVQSIT